MPEVVEREQVKAVEECHFLRQTQLAACGME